MWPLLPDPAHVFTYHTSAPLRTHWRLATCAEVECPNHLNGWDVYVADPSPAADWIRARSGRQFTEERQPGGMVRFGFEAGQRCFEADDHRVPVGRPPLYLVREGNARVYRPLRVHTSAESWTDDLRTQSEKIERQRNG